MSITNPIDEYILASKKVYDLFNCGLDYFIKPMLSANWHILTDDGVFFLRYGEKQNLSTAVIVKDEGEPIIIRSNDFTMVVGIDCIKIAFVFKNANEI